MAIEDWYDARRMGLGTEFRAAVDEAMARIAAHPLMYPERYRASRRALLRRFPYVLWYRVDDDLVIILACVHGRRDPRGVRARLGEGA